MATFFTDSDLVGTGETTESEVWLATEFTVPDGTASFRWRWPAVSPVVTPVIRVYNAGGTLVAGPIAFDSTTLSAWNTAGAGSPVALSAGTYRVTVNTNRYVFVAGFFSGGSITRGSITGVRSRFGPVGSAPASTSTATYLVDIDFTASGGGGPSAAPNGLAVPATPGQPTVSILGAAPSGLAVTAALGSPATALSRTATPAGIAVPASLGSLTVGRNGASPSGLIVAPSLGTPTAAETQSAAPAGIPVAVALGAPSTTAPERAITIRPNAGTTSRPDAGITLRP